jgi:hypothetical protein
MREVSPTNRTNTVAANTSSRYFANSSYLTGTTTPLRRRRTSSSAEKTWDDQDVARQIQTTTTTTLSSISKNSTKNVKGVVVSPYFLRSPSSVYGSVQSLGPLIYTWCSSGIESRKRSHRVAQHTCCQQRQQSTSTSSSPEVEGTGHCSSCQEIVHDALRHFDCCHIFQEQKKKHASLLFRCCCHTKIGHKVKKIIEDTDIDNTRVSSSSSYHCCGCCIERVGYLVENYWVRHICRNQCFLRAFAPSRDWMTLRRSVAQYCHLTDNAVSVDVLLKDWACCLVGPGQEQLQQENPTTSNGADGIVTYDDEEEETENQVSTEGGGYTPCHRRSRKRSLHTTNGSSSSIAKRKSLVPKATTASRTEFVWFVRSYSNADEKASENNSVNPSNQLLSDVCMDVAVGTSSL